MNKLIEGTGKNVSIFTFLGLIIITDVAENNEWRTKLYAYQISEDIRKIFLFDMSLVTFNYPSLDIQKTFLEITFLSFAFYIGFH